MPAVARLSCSAYGSFLRVAARSRLIGKVSNGLTVSYRSSRRELVLRAESGPNGVASGRTGVSAQAAIPLRASRDEPREDRAAWLVGPKNSLFSMP